MNFIHLSDLHFHMDDADNAPAKAVLDYVAGEYGDHYLIVTGDITDDGHELQYENALKELEKFRGRIFICPGNHDFGAMGNFYSEERAERFDAMLGKPLGQGGTFKGYNVPVVNVVKDGGDSMRIIAIDSNLETTNPFDFACGEVGEGQRHVLDEILNGISIPETRTMVILHHHPFIHNNPFMELIDARAFMRTIYNRVDLVLFGHKHVSKVWSAPEITGVQYAIAADNAPGKAWARRITLKNQVITVTDVRIA